MRLGWGLSSAPDAAQQECCEQGATLLCMGLFSRFFVQALPCTAEGALCRGPLRPSPDRVVVFEPDFASGPICNPQPQLDTGSPGGVFPPNFRDFRNVQGAP